jgi:glutamine amidotransferase
MRELTGRGFVEPLHDAAEAGVPLFGVCMGMQLLMDSSTEDAPSEDQPIPGLGLIPGRVVRFSEQSSGSDERLKVPHMGWNRLEPVGDNLLVAGLSESAYVYFVHSYYCVPMKDTAVAARATYGQPFCASICQGNLWACQFHPEKSQQVGLKILENFVGC